MEQIVVFMIFSLTIPIRIQTSATTHTQWKNFTNEIETNGEENTELSFILPSHTDEPKTWTIYAVSGFPRCGGKESSFSNQSGYIESCFRKNLSYMNDHYDNFIVKLPKFEIANAGTWIIRRLYEKFNKSGSFSGYIEDNNSINVYRIQYDQRFHNKTIEVKENEYIVIYFPEKSSDNTACDLHHDETGDSYDLNENSYRFYEEGAAVQRFGPCGFRMHVRNTSEGEWTLTGQFGWTRHRATFQVLIKPQIQRPIEDFFTELDYLYDDLSSNIIIMFSGTAEYWELERPDGHIIQPSDTSLMDLLYKNKKLPEVNVFLGATSNNDQGLWKARVAYKNQAYLREDQYFFVIENTPQTLDKWRSVSDATRNEIGIKMEVSVKRYDFPRRCSFKKQNGTFIESEQEDRYSYIYLYRCCSVIFDGNSVGEQSLETSFDFEDSKINSIFSFDIAGRNRRTLQPVFWYSVRPIKYVKLGEELEVKCKNSEPLVKCVLNRSNGTSYIYGESSLLNSTDCYDTYGSERIKVMGYCGCVLTIAHATEGDAGNWTCDMELAQGQEIQSIVRISVMKSHLIPEIEMKNDKVTLHCRTFPTLYHDKIGYCKWYLRTKGLISTENSTKYNATNGDHVCSLQLNGLNEKDIDEWTCAARLHFAGIVNATIVLQEFFHPAGKKENITYESSEISGSIIIFCAIFVFILIVTVGLFIYFCIFEKKRLKKEVEEARSITKIIYENVMEGPVNPHVLLHEQTEFLHYDEKRLEYPCKKLSVMKRWGSGNFGIVEKARAPNIMKDGKVTDVAVKKVSPTASHVDKRALIMELKILSVLPVHPNVVNLLGACTRDVPGGGLWIIFEFCRHGDLRNYIKKHKSAFIDQVDLIAIENADLQEKTENILRNQPSSNPQNESDLESGSHSRVTMPDLSNLSYDSDDCPYKAEYPRNLAKPFSTGDLLHWVLQVATGMEFLSKEKVLHGDLALRNILLTEKKTVKICDFGLARSIRDGCYRQVINNKRPHRIAAIESLRDKIFSTESDVWAFGVLLWECFSLGETPYLDEDTDGVRQPSVVLLDKLLGGYRLKKPMYASEELHNLMLLCWNEEPAQRPKFGEIVAEIGKLV